MKTLKTLKTPPASPVTHGEQGSPHGDLCAGESEALPLYTDKHPPRVGALVVVRTVRIDGDNGIWGELPEWGAHSTAYLRPGAAAPSKKAARAFLTSALRGVRSSCGHTFVAEVSYAELVVETAAEAETEGNARDSSSADAIPRVRLEVSVDRRPLCGRRESSRAAQPQQHASSASRAAAARSEPEQLVLDRWHAATRAAACVDRAAASVGLSRRQARRLVLFAAFERAAGYTRCTRHATADAREDADDEDDTDDADGGGGGGAGGNGDCGGDDANGQHDSPGAGEPSDEGSCDAWEVGESGDTDDRDDDGVAPELAAARWLARIGREHLRAVAQASDPGTPHLARALLGPTGRALPAAFARALVAECAAEAMRLRRPTKITLCVHLREPHEARTPSADAMRAAAARVEALEPPPGVSAVSVRARAPPSYALEAIFAPSAEEHAARAFLRAAEQHAREVLARGEYADARAASSPPARPAPDGSAGEPPRLVIGLLGDVAHGKSSLCAALTGERTQRHEAERRAHGATLRLGYASARLYRCACRCAPCAATGPEPVRGAPARAPTRPPSARACACSFAARPDSAARAGAAPECPACAAPMGAWRVVSFVDCPGHAELTSTALRGCAALDGALLVVAAAGGGAVLGPALSSQARAHLCALDAAPQLAPGQLAVVQTKVDRVAARASAAPRDEAHAPGDDEAAAIAAALAARARATRAALSESRLAAGAPIFPAAPLLGIGLDAVVRWLALCHARAAAPPPGSSAGARLHVLRSFDVNKPGTRAAQLAGGVLGGALERGTLRAGDWVEVRPGLAIEPERLRAPGGAPLAVRPLRARVDGIMLGARSVDVATPGALFAVRTSLCPSLCAADRLAGAVCGAVGTLPPVWHEIELSQLIPAAAIAADAKPVPARAHGERERAEGESSGPAVEALRGETLAAECAESALDDRDASRAPRPEKPRARKVLRVGSRVRVHAGVAMAGGVVTAASGRARTATVQLGAALCAAPGCVLAIEGEHAVASTGGATPPATAMRLCAHALLAGGERCQMRRAGAAADVADATEAVPAGGGSERASESAERAPADAVASAAPSAAPPSAVGAPASCVLSPAVNPAHEGEQVAWTPEEEAGCRLRVARALVEHSMQGGDTLARSHRAPSLPPFELARSSVAYVMWPTFARTAEALGRPAEHLAAYVRAEGGLRCSRALVDGEGLRVRWVGNGLPRKLAGIVREYVREAVVCHQCGGFDTRLSRGVGDGTIAGDCVELHCARCCAMRYVRAHQA